MPAPLETIDDLRDPLGSLAARALDAHACIRNSRVILEGPPPNSPAKDVLTIAIPVHEARTSRPSGSRPVDKISSIVLPSIVY
jgi:hypothetical protein